MAFAEAFYQAVFHKGLDIPFRKTLACQLRCCPLVALQVGKAFFNAAAGFLGVGLPIVGRHVVFNGTVGNNLHIFLKVNGKLVFLAPHVPGEGKRRGPVL